MIATLILGIACQVHPSQSDTHAAVVPNIPTTDCGRDAYQWHSLDGMGSLAAAQEMETYSLSSETLNVILGGTAYSGLAPVESSIKSYRIRYQTQSRGEPVETTAIVVMPDVDGPVPILLYLHPTTGFSDSCAPSALGLTGWALPMLFASYGMAVVAPDYLGMNGWGEPSQMLHPYVIGEATAVASLDGLRALMALHEAEEFSAQPDPERVVFWGASEGGFAALWVDRYAPHYAPEFFPVGTIAAIPATDPLGLAEHAVVNYGPTSSAIAAALVTMQDWYGQGDLSTVFSEAPFNALEVLPELVATTCDDYSALSEVSQSSELYAESFIASIASGEFVDPWTCYLQEGVLRESVVPLASDTPTLMILAEEDDLAIPELVRSDMPVLCDQGYRIEHLECAGASHTAAAVQTLPYQLAWARDRMAGAPWNPTALCEITDPVDCEALQ